MFLTKKKWQYFTDDIKCPAGGEFEKTSSRLEIKMKFNYRHATPKAVTLVTLTIVKTNRWITTIEIISIIATVVNKAECGDINTDNQCQQHQYRRVS